MFVRSFYKKAHGLFAVPSVSVQPLNANLIHTSRFISKLNNDQLLPSSIINSKLFDYLQFRTLSKLTQDQASKPKTPPQPQPLTSQTVENNKAITHKQLQSTPQSQMHRQLAPTEKSERELYKLNTDDLTGKKLGWIVSGTAIGVISALFGKIYMLFGVVPLFLYHSKDMDVMSKNFNRDVLFLWRYSKCWRLSKRIKNEDLTLPKVFHLVSKKNADKMMLQMHDQNWKYKDVASYANRTSRLMQKYGLQKGDVVAMLASNSPEMVAIVLGLANIGIVTALINTDLRNDGLIQAIQNSKCKGIIFDDELMHAFGDVYKIFEETLIFQIRHKAKCPQFRVLEEELIKECNEQPEMFINVHYDDPLLHMYAADDNEFKEPIIISHEKFLFDSNATATMLDLKSTDKIYNPTPLHEPTGIILGIGPSITYGVPTVLRSKFSATDYFKECYVYNCTVGQYAGNMCKHLLLSPVSPIETFHPVKLMYGTGLDSDYWQEFVNRFGTKMYEVQDAAKDNPNLINMEGKIGVVGFRPKLAPSFMFPHYVIKVFGKEKIPIRNANGVCQLCDYGEPGMLIRLWDTHTPLPPKAKTITDIFKIGDIAVTNGQILTIDENLYLRPIKKHMDKSWVNKLITSEEVEYIASKLTSKRCAAYSLQLGYKKDIEILAIEDGNKTLNMKKFTDDLVDHLPKTWVPHYVCIVNKFELTKNNKVNKKKLVDQGLHMEGNFVFYFDKDSISYKPLIWGQTNRPQIIVNESQMHFVSEEAIKTASSENTSNLTINADSDNKYAIKLESSLSKVCSAQAESICVPKATQTNPPPTQVKTTNTNARVETKPKNAANAMHKMTTEQAMRPLNIVDVKSIKSLLPKTGEHLNPKSGTSHTTFVKNFEASKIIEKNTHFRDAEQKKDEIKPLDYTGIKVQIIAPQMVEKKLETKPSEAKVELKIENKAETIIPKVDAKKADEEKKVETTVESSPPKTEEQMFKLKNPDESSIFNFVSALLVENQPLRDLKVEEKKVETKAEAKVQSAQPKVEAKSEIIKTEPITSTSTSSKVEEKIEDTKPSEAKVQSAQPKVEAKSETITSKTTSSKVEEKKEDTGAKEKDQSAQPEVEAKSEIIKTEPITSKTTTPKVEEKVQSAQPKVEAKSEMIKTDPITSKTNSSTTASYWYQSKSKSGINVNTPPKSLKSVKNVSGISVNQKLLGLDKLKPITNTEAKKDPESTSVFGSTTGITIKQGTKFDDKIEDTISQSKGVWYEPNKSINVKINAIDTEQAKTSQPKNETSSVFGSIQAGMKAQSINKEEKKEDTKSDTKSVWYQAKRPVAESQKSININLKKNTNVFGQEKVEQPNKDHTKPK